MPKKRNTAPAVIRGRKGKRSVADVLIQLLWPKDNNRPSLSLPKLQASCSEILDCQITDSTLRSIIYRRPEIFEKTNDKNPVQYRLKQTFVEQHSEK